MAELRLVYRGDRKVEMVNQTSGCTIETHAPEAGKALASNTPIDLVAGALAACTLSMLAAGGKVQGYDPTGATAEVSYTMDARHTRLETIRVVLHLEALQLNAKQRVAVERIARSCPVYQSLREDLEKKFDFIYE